MGLKGVEAGTGIEARGSVATRRVATGRDAPGRVATVTLQKGP